MLSFWHVHESLFGELVLLEVSLVKLYAALENFDEFLTWVKFMIPKDIITSWLTFLSGDTKLDSSKVKDGELAVCDHLVGDFGE